MLDLRPVVAAVVAIKAITDATPLDENSFKVASGVSSACVHVSCEGSKLVSSSQCIFCDLLKSLFSVCLFWVFFYFFLQCSVCGP